MKKLIETNAELSKVTVNGNDDDEEGKRIQKKVNVNDDEDQEDCKQR